MSTNIPIFLSQHKQTIACAESCTAGLIALHLSDTPGASDIFSGGVIAYSEEAKIKILDVSHDIITKYGVVSEEVAMQMALGAKKLFSVDWALSTTGYAGPTGGTKKAPLGTLCCAICGPKDNLSKRFILKNLSRAEYQNKACDLVLELLAKTFYNNF
jgi:nicotinamide-nucleotide amidase